MRAHKASGERLNLAFVDVFELRNGKICRLISCLMEIKADDVTAA